MNLVWFGLLAEFDLVWSIHRQTNKMKKNIQFLRFKKTQVYSHNVLTTWNRLLSNDDTAADAAARSFVVSGCKAGCERPELCYNDGGIYTV